MSNNGKVIRLEKWNKDIAYSDKVDVTSYISRLVGSGGTAPFKSMCKNEIGTVNVNNDWDCNLLESLLMKLATTLAWVTTVVKINVREVRT